MQEIVVYIIVASIVLYLGYKIYKAFTRKVSSASCGGCTGCDIKGPTSCH